MKTKLFIDFDGTIFSTSRFKRDIFHLFKKAGYSEQEIEKTYWEECRDYKYSIEGNLRRLEKIRGYNKEKIDPLLEKIYRKVKKYVYKDTKTFLRKIDREKYKVNLLSLGDIGFQRLKVDHSGLVDLFQDIFITDQQKWLYLKNLLEQDEKFIIIDDRADTTEKIKAIFPNSNSIRILRKDYDRNDPYVNLQCPNGVTQVENLKQALKYL